MKLILGLIAFIIAFYVCVTFTRAEEAPPQPQPKITTIMIGDSPGGNVGEYIEVVQKAIADDAEVRIYGKCMSACTLFLSVPRICVGKYAEMWFHQPFGLLGGKAETGVRIYSEDISETLLSLYPKNVQSWIMEHGGLNSEMIQMTPLELKKLGFPECKGSF